uniref:Uncharacterized protein n=1 Tax=Lepeophtheirus salmonis TaxID=72036 RepID=A0A0K2TIR5_LEPSM
MTLGEDTFLIEHQCVLLRMEMHIVYEEIKFCIIYKYLLCFNNSKGFGRLCS